MRRKQREDTTYEGRKEGRPPYIGIAFSTVLKGRRQHSSRQVVGTFLRGDSCGRGWRHLSKAGIFDEADQDRYERRTT
jgi:hypothetical protein